MHDLNKIQDIKNAVNEIVIKNSSLKILNKSRHLRYGLYFCIGCITISIIGLILFHLDYFIAGLIIIIISLILIVIGLSCAFKKVEKEIIASNNGKISQTISHENSLDYLKKHGFYVETTMKKTSRSSIQ